MLFLLGIVLALGIGAALWQNHLPHRWWGGYRTAAVAHPGWMKVVSVLIGAVFALVIVLVLDWAFSFVAWPTWAWWLLLPVLVAGFILAFAVHVAWLPLNWFWRFITNLAALGLAVMLVVFGLQMANFELPRINFDGIKIAAQRQPTATASPTPNTLATEIAKGFAGINTRIDNLQATVSAPTPANTSNGPESTPTPAYAPTSTPNSQDKEVLSRIIEGEQVPTYTPMPSPTATIAPTSVLTKTEEIQSGNPGSAMSVDLSKWSEVPGSFHPAGDLRQTFNINHDGKQNMVTLTWFNVEVEDPKTGQFVKLGSCSVRVTTFAIGERLATNGAYRTFVFDGQPTKEDVQALVSWWVSVLESEPRGGCAFPGAYTVSWQDSSLSDGFKSTNVQPNMTPTVQPSATNAPKATSTTAPTNAPSSQQAAKFEEGEFYPNPNASQGKPVTMTVDLKSGEVAVAWWKAHMSEMRDDREIQIVTKSGSKVTFEGAMRIYKWTGDAYTREELNKLAVWFAGERSKEDGQNWSFRIQ